MPTAATEGGDTPCRPGLRVPSACERPSIPGDPVAPSGRDQLCHCGGDPDVGPACPGRGLAEACCSSCVPLPLSPACAWSRSSYPFMDRMAKRDLEAHRAATAARRPHCPAYPTRRRTDRCNAERAARDSRERFLAWHAVRLATMRRTPSRSAEASRTISPAGSRRSVASHDPARRATADQPEAVPKWVAEDHRPNRDKGVHDGLRLFQALSGPVQIDPRADRVLESIYGSHAAPLRGHVHRLTKVLRQPYGHCRRERSSGSAIEFRAGRRALHGAARSIGRQISR